MREANTLQRIDNPLYMAVYDISNTKTTTKTDIKRRRDSDRSTITKLNFALSNRWKAAIRTQKSPMATCAEAIRF